MRDSDHVTVAEVAEEARNGFALVGKNRAIRLDSRAGEYLAIDQSMPFSIAANQNRIAAGQLDLPSGGHLELVGMPGRIKGAAWPSKWRRPAWTRSTMNDWPDSSRPARRVRVTTMPGR